MPRPTIAAQIQTATQFKTLLDTLSLDIGEAQDHYTLFCNLLAAKEGDYTGALSQSQTFWSLTYGAHFDAAVFRLCRIYDQKDDALSLRTLLAVIKEAPTFLPIPTLPLDPDGIDSDLAAASHETNAVVKHLMLWRHKVYSHRDVARTIQRDMADKFPINHEDIVTMLARGSAILNKYNLAFFRAVFAREIPGGRDYLNVLTTLQRDADEQQQAFRAEMERLKTEL